MSDVPKISYPIGSKNVQGGVPTAVLNTLQFNAVTNQWEFVAVVAASLSEIEFIRDQVIAGNWFEVSGNINAVGNTIVFIPVLGKTAFLYEAKIVITGHVLPVTTIAISSNLTSTNMVQAELKIDGIIKDTVNLGVNSHAQADDQPTARVTSTNAFGSLSDGKFNVKGLSLIGDGVREIIIENTLDTGNAFATMSGFIQDT